MVNWEERRHLVKIANLYYNENWTQEQIAKKFSVSRPIISKSLQKAKDIGIIEVYINDETVHTVDLEKQLEKKFRMKDVLVTPSTNSGLEMTMHSVGRAGAHYLSRNIKGVNSIGVSWGHTLTSLVKEYPYELRKDIKITPLEGGMGQKMVEIHANQIAYELAKKMGGTCSYLYAPAIVESEELRKRLMGMQDINDVLEEGKNVEVALIGIGNPYLNSTLESIGYLQKNDLFQLEKMGVAGDMGFRFFDSSGSSIDNSLEKKLIGISLEELSQIQSVIAVVAGVHKADSLLAALKGNYIDVLVTDEETAKRLLKLSE